MSMFWDHSALGLPTDSPRVPWPDSVPLGQQGWNIPTVMLMVRSGQKTPVCVWKTDHSLLATWQSRSVAKVFAGPVSFIQIKSYTFRVLFDLLRHFSQLSLQVHYLFLPSYIERKPNSLLWAILTSGNIETLPENSFFVSNKSPSSSEDSFQIIFLKDILTLYFDR